VTKSLNRLKNQSSPYLKQHADNPVNWFPWGDEALELAKSQNKPILLSIGYSACHWCHVMAHESFEDETTAKLMNDFFINIKVDREERPDLDKIYQSAHQIITQRPGGWPLTMFLSPNDQLPFFGGTYFPDTPRHGLISFRQLLQRVYEVFETSPDKISQQAQVIAQSLNQMSRQPVSATSVNINAVEKFVIQMLNIHDSKNGGFGSAPKFPQPAMLEQAARICFQDKNSALFEALDFSLKKIASGGIQDHLTGGFFRYSVDDLWMIPHFEKMMYDNGQLLRVFSLMFQLTSNSLYRQAVVGIIHWAETEMRADSGAFYAALDADSEGIEGKFYVWTKEEIKSLLNDQQYQILAEKFGLNRKANFEGQWHLHSYIDNQKLGKKLNIDETALKQQLAGIKQLLLKRRNQRIRPGLDNKILTSWNALLINGLGTAARCLNDEHFYQLACETIDALIQNNWSDDHLLACSIESGNRLSAYVDDVAFLLQALLECLQYRWQNAHLQLAIQLAEILLAYFADQQGGFFFTASDHEKLIQRPKSWQDEAMPNGNAIASYSLYRLGLLLDETRYTNAAEKALASAAEILNQSPLYTPGALHLLQDIHQPPMLVIISGKTNLINQWRKKLIDEIRPDRLFFFIDNKTTGLPDSLAGKITKNDIGATICYHFFCHPPLDNFNQLIKHIQQPHEA